jgi:xylose isomerase
MARLAILTLFMGQTRNRFLQYQEPRSILEILDMAGRTEGCEGVELRYPGDLADPKAVKAALERNNLGIAAINFASVRPDRWLRGAWSSTKPEERRAAVDDFKRCIDVAREIGAPRITNCPLNDGIDYAFELDFAPPSATRKSPTTTRRSRSASSTRSASPGCARCSATPGRRRRSARSSTATTWA